MAKAKKAGGPDGLKIVAKNRKAFHDFHIVERVEAGVSLQGSEVKSLRNQNVSLQEGYVKVDHGEAWLLGVHIAPYENAGYASHDPLRKRRLLLHRREIRKLAEACDRQGMTMVPLSLYFKQGWAKIEVGLAKGKRHEDKRQDLKSKDAKREVERALFRKR